jgi:serine/threonine protein kinase
MRATDAPLRESASSATRADMGTPNQAGRRLGDFQLEKKIGQGGMGEVYRARQISLDRPVAVKVLTRGLASQPGFVERFQREAKAAANVVHPHIIQIYAYGIDNGTPYFAMEYVEGEDLQQRMRRVKRIPVDEIVDIMISVASALGAAHEKNMIHRDVKPSNVMIDRSGNVKVMDFGLAKAASADGSLTQSGVIMGTPNYLSPEQGRGDPIDGRADLYSLGVVMYELLAGDLPFRADTPAGLIFKHVYEEPPTLTKRNAEVPPFVEEIVHRLLKKDPDDRYQKANDLLLDLHEFMDAHEHYMAGGARRDVRVSTSARLRGLSSSRSGETTVMDAVQVQPDGEGVARPPSGGSRPPSGPSRPPSAPSRPPSEPKIVSKVAEERPPSSSDAVNTSQVTIIRERTSMAPFWVLLFMVALAGASWFAYKNGLLAQWGLVSGRANLQLSGAELGPTVKARLVSKDQSFSRDLAADTGYSLEPGTYHLTALKHGYKTIDTDLLVQDQNGAAKLVMPNGTPFTWSFDPLPEMAVQYQKGKELLEQFRQTKDMGALTKAKTELGVVEDLDYKPGEGQETARELLRAIDMEIAASTKRYGDGESLATQKKWRSLMSMAEPLKADPRWASLYEQAKRATEEADAGIEKVDKAKEAGDLDLALSTLQEVTRNDPENTRIVLLRANLEDLKNKHDDALNVAIAVTGNPAASESDLARARDALLAYLEKAHGDAAMKEKLDRIQERLNTDKARPVEQDIKDKNWRKADIEWTALQASRPDHPMLGTWRQQIDDGLREEKIKDTVDRLDQGLVEPDPATKLAPFLDTTSAGIARELTAFAEMAEVHAYIRASKHTVDVSHVSVEGTSVYGHIEGSWKVSLEIQGETMAFDRPYKAELKLVGGDWKFTSFAVESK